ncbi:MAG: hypothetical protein ACOC78_01040, partial [Actinomycetota bacterium]
MIMKTKICTDCGVPEAVGRNYEWNTDGTITYKNHPERRVVILETENLRGLFDVLEKMIDKPLEPIITDIKRRSALYYLRSLFSEPRVKGMQFLGMHPVFRYLADRALVLGHGKLKLLKVKRLRSAEVKVSWPHSRLMSLGDFAAAAQVSLRGPVKTEWEPLEENRYIFKAGTSPLEKTADERLHVPLQPRIPGNLEYRMCSKCAVPLEINRYQWDVEKGIITDPLTSRRIAICEVWDMESLVRELERELGRDVTPLIVDAQRRFIESAFSQEEVRMSREGYRRLLSLRGLGFLRDFEFYSTM